MYKAPRGTSDILPEDQNYWRYIETTAMNQCHLYGFQRLDTPVFEESELFLRSVGEGTDIVEKEMYTFQDRGEELLTLRPEGTAPVCRAYLERGMHNLSQPVRLYYFCPVFRYERPQAGRFRQHHQFGIEVLGDGDASIDAEVVELGWQLMTNLGLKDLSLLINSIGDSSCRPNYLEVLKGHYGAHYDHLCVDCCARLERNPLRLLDCKQEGCQLLTEKAPRSTEYLCAECAEHWKSLLCYLDTIAIPYRIDHRLVRGLDYYTRTVFELQPPEEGSQSTLCGGGRYDGLIEQLGGQPTPGIGFAAGMERLVLNLKRQEILAPDEPSPHYLVATVGTSTRDEAIKLASVIRRSGSGAILSNASRSLKGQLRQANSLGIPYVVIVGEDELAQGQITLRDMGTGSQELMSTEQFLKELNLT